MDLSQHDNEAVGDSSPVSSKKPPAAKNASKITKSKPMSSISGFFQNIEKKVEGVFDSKNRDFAQTASIFSKDSKRRATDQPVTKKGNFLNDHAKLGATGLEKTDLVGDQTIMKSHDEDIHLQNLVSGNAS